MKLLYSNELKMFWIKADYCDYKAAKMGKEYKFSWNPVKRIWYTEDVLIAMNLYLEADYKTRKIIKIKLNEIQNMKRDYNRFKKGRNK